MGASSTVSARFYASQLKLHSDSVKIYKYHLLSSDKAMVTNV